MAHVTSLLTACIMLSLVSGANAGSWDDFVNNLSTDLAPIIALFGEQVTKQWLSESLTIWDNIIFAMGPLGILTAVVSAIRVAGGPNLKAFIGRAQESPGVAELELLSCTSDTTAELWNQGGIARVFGKPSILEVVFRSRKETTDSSQSSSTTPKYIYSVEPIHESLGDEGAWEIKRKTRKRSFFSSVEASFTEAIFREQRLKRETARAGSPNLSLNIGIKRRQESWFRVAALLGVLLQSGVLVFGALSVYRYQLQFPITPKRLSSTDLSDDPTPAFSWAFPVTFCGTGLLCLGMFLCAYVIEQVTDETYYRKKPAGAIGNERDGDIYWVQMDNQKIGDQVFGAFIGKHPSGQEYLRSRKEEHAAPKNGINARFLWPAVIVTMLGFVLQFIGLRYLHPAIALAQLAVTVSMAIIRASLRTQRLSSNSNLIAPIMRKIIEGHELDYLAFVIETPEYPSLVERDFARCFQLCLHLQPAGAPIFVDTSYANRANNLFRLRVRLAELTTISENPIIDWRGFEVRNTSVDLKRAIEEVMKLLFGVSDSSPKIRTQWRDRGQFSWSVSVRGDGYFAADGPEYVLVGGQADIKIEVTRENITQESWTPWKIKAPELEALIGLWTWSVRGDYRYRSAWTRRYGSRGLAWFGNERERQRLKCEFENWIQLESSVIEAPAKGQGLFYGFQPSREAPLPLELRLLRTATTTGDSGLRFFFAQDLFVAFLVSVSEQIVDDIGGTTSFKSKMNNGDNRRGFQLVNTHVVSIVKIFEDTGLGSKDAAYACVFSALHAAKKMPSTEGVFERICEVVVPPHHTESEWERAESLLWWAYSLCLPTHGSTVLEELGKFYARAIYSTKDKSATRSQRGVQGLARMLELLKDPDNEESDTILSYAWTGLQAAEPHGSVLRTKEVQTFEDQLLREDSTSRWIQVCNSNVNMLKYLLGHQQSKIGLNSQDSAGRTLLSWAAECNIELTEWLCERPEIDHNLADKEGQTPLMALSGIEDIVKVLLPHARPSLGNKSKDGKTALMLAKENNHVGVYTLLLTGDISGISDD